MQSVLLLTRCSFNCTAVTCTRVITNTFFSHFLFTQSNKVDLTHGLFSAVTGIRRFGDLANNNNNASNGASNGAHGTGTGASAKASTLKKRTFSEVGKLGSTVAAQQFVFGAGETSFDLFHCFY